MNDRQILDEVYRLMTQMTHDAVQDRSNVPLSNIQEFIEREWQRQDEAAEQEQKDLYADTTFSKSWYKSENDNRHRVLKIDKDGTVKGLK